MRPFYALTYYIPFLSVINTKKLEIIFLSSLFIADSLKKIVPYYLYRLPKNSQKRKFFYQLDSLIEFRIKFLNKLRKKSKKNFYSAKKNFIFNPAFDSNFFVRNNEL